MNLIKTILAAASLSGVSLGYVATANAAETIKPLQGISFQAANKEATLYYLAEQGTCKVVLTLTEKTAYAPTRFELAIEPSNPSLHQLDETTALELACMHKAQALTINTVSMVADE